jgi:hypothetical protein
MDYEITCVDKNEYGVIVSVGCLDGSRFSKQKVIDLITKNGDYFYTWDSVLQKVATVEVIKSSQLGGLGFIKSAADCTTRNNLDNLPPCK